MLLDKQTGLTQLVIGSKSVALSMQPRFNTDFVFIASVDCSNCGNQVYDISKSKWGVPGNQTIGTTSFYNQEDENRVFI